MRIAVRFAVVVGLVLASLGVGARTTVASSRAGGCSEPYPPAAIVDEYPGQQPVPSLPGTTVEASLPAAIPVDSDGDGRPDTVKGDGDDVVLTRHDGLVRFHRPGAHLTVDGATPGDLDGDGRDEIVVADTDPAPDTYGLLQRAAWLVPGAVATGTSDPGTVGIRIPVGAALPLADRDGDGHPDFALVETQADHAHTTRIVSGAKALAAGPGSDATDSAVLRSVPGSFGGLIDEAGRPQPTVLTGEYRLDPVAGGIDALVMRLARSDGTVVALTSPAIAADGPSLLGAVRLVHGPAGDFLLSSRGSRSGNQTIIWRLDDPCGPLPPQPTTTTVGFQSGPAVECAAPIPATVIDVDEAPVQEGPPLDLGPNALWEAGTIAGDLDGDGRPDLPSIDGSPTVASFQGGSEPIRIGAPGRPTLPYQLGTFDLDGDGHDDVLVEVGTNEVGTGGAVYAIAGPLAPGTYDPTRVGVRLPSAWSKAGIRSVGDQDHDGADDLLVGANELFGGRAILAPGPGGVAAPAPYRTLDGVVPQRDATIADFGAGPTLLIVRQVDATTATITLGLDGPTLTTRGRDLSGPLADPAYVTAFANPAGPVVALEQEVTPGERPLAYWVWKLFGPCGGPAPTPPAIPQAGPATFTG